MAVGTSVPSSAASSVEGYFARVGKEQQLLHLRGQRRRCGIAELAVHRIQRIECGPAQRAVIDCISGIKDVRDRMPVPILIGRIRKAEIGVIEHGVDIVRTGTTMSPAAASNASSLSESTWSRRRRTRSIASR